jgi:uncharacterized protein YdcH (DUF465 family)
LSAKQFGILTLQQMSGSTSHKLRRTVADLSEILGRWERLLSTEAEIDPHDLDAESEQDLLLLNPTAHFQLVLRLLPDMFTKFFKCLELAKQWWVLAHEIYAQLPINRPPTPQAPSPSTGIKLVLEEEEEEDGEGSEAESVSEKVPAQQLMQRLEQDIALKCDQLLAQQEELRVLEERERHFESLVEAYEKVTAQLADKNMERKDLVSQREKNLVPHQLQLGDTSPQQLDDMVAATDRQLQLLQFQQSLLVQDYMLQLEVRPSLIRFAEDLRQKTQTTQSSLTDQKIARLKLQELMEQGVDAVDPKNIQEPHHLASSPDNGAGKPTPSGTKSPASAGGKSTPADLTRQDSSHSVGRPADARRKSQTSKSKVDSTGSKPVTKAVEKNGGDAVHGKSGEPQPKRSVGSKSRNGAVKEKSENSEAGRPRAKSESNVLKNAQPGSGPAARRLSTTQHKEDAAFGPRSNFSQTKQPRDDRTVSKAGEAKKDSAVKDDKTKVGNGMSFPKPSTQEAPKKSEKGPGMQRGDTGDRKQLLQKVSQSHDSKDNKVTQDGGGSKPPRAPDANKEKTATHARLQRKTSQPNGLVEKANRQ